ncbi:CHAT domain-containing protein [Reichenbachiella agarivorans]|uniref:CHAT domain-containing protein n=1 Tax=Reichenbachiella agarivorans TaxID=2979464 RepID=A0ABY6CKB3_9BACT|nr:CHAT domain-containing protein [Reichenbachiella agarivorans]UXP30966.1 CHAT domain-containing protein [Reichenbachiella agarivorans]
MKNLRPYLLILFILSANTSLWAQKNDAQSMLSQAQALYEDLVYEEAFKAFQKSNEKANSETALQGMVRSLFELGNQLQFNGNTGAAKTNYNQALGLAKTLDKQYPDRADNLLLRGLMYLYNEQRENAKTDFQYVNLRFPDNGRAYYYLWTQEPVEGLAKTEHFYVQKALEIDPKLFELHQELGSYYAAMDMADEAIEHYNHALEISPKNYKANFALGQIYWALGDLDQMRIHFENSLRYFPDFAYAQMALAGVELMSGNLTASVPLIRSALKINPATDAYLDMYIENFPDLASYNFRETVVSDSPYDNKGYPKYYQEAVTLAQSFDFYAAIEKFHQCHDVYSRLEYNEPAWTVSILAWLTHCYRETGAYADAVHTSQQALNLAVQHNLTTDQASLAANLSMIYYAWGDYPNALKTGRLSIQYLLAYHQEDKLYDAYTNLGVYYRKWGLSDSAVYYHQKALTHVDKAQNDLLALAKKELALSYSADLQYDKAQKALEEMLDLQKNHDMKGQESALDFGSAQVYYQAGMYNEANEYIEKSFPYFQSLQESNPIHLSLTPFIQNYIGITVNLDQIDLAYHNYVALNFNLIGQIKDFFPAMNENGKLLFYREVKQYFESFNSFAVNHTNMNQEVLTQMYENQLMIKGLLFNNAIKIQRSVLNSDDQNLKKLYTQLITKKNLLARSITFDEEERSSRNINVDKIQLQIDSLETQLLRSDINLSTNQVYEENLVKKVKGQLKPNEAAIEIVRFRNYDFAKGGSFTDQVQYLALILRGDRDMIDYVMLDQGNELENRHYLAYVNAIEYELEDRVSHDLFWSPIKEKLAQIQKAYFAGDGIYHKINLNTLYHSQSNQYVIDQLDIRLITSTRDLLKTTPELPKRGDVLLVGFPSFEMDSEPNSKIDVDENIDMMGTRAFTSLEYLTPLPGTYSEVNKIATLLKSSKWKTKVLTGNAALEGTIKAVSSPTILHIATHGYFEESSDRDNPLLYSGLFLSGATSNYRLKKQEGEDGILTAYEAMHLNLSQTQMVVLSACETGMGRIENGEGVYGLQRAFLIAGSKSVIMSMWKVNDQTTMELMSDFYARLETARDKHVTFREAQLALKELHPSPKYWGAFNIVGK